MTDYQKYQLQWMIDHGKSIDDLIRAINKHHLDCDPSDDLLENFWSWEQDVGFGGEIWACEDEWEDCENDQVHQVDQRVCCKHRCGRAVRL